MNFEQEMIEELKAIRRELATTRQLVSRGINDMINAEKEVPEMMRRFANYFHDIHHIIWTYEERGHQAPNYLKRELERMDDRMRQLQKELHTDGGVFEKVRREMAADPENKWDHTRLLFKPKENGDAGKGQA